MIVESNMEEEIVINGIIGKFFRNKHMLLIYLARKEEDGGLSTVIEVKKAFRITKKYAWALLAKLEEDNLIKKSEKVAIDGGEYHSYILTKKAKRDLKILSLYLSRYSTNCRSSKYSKCPYSSEPHMKTNPSKKEVV